MTQPAPIAMSTPETIFCAALELSVSKWKVAFTNGLRVRLVTIDAGDLSALEKQTASARGRLEIPDGQPRCSPATKPAVTGSGFTAR
jgi:hypothetical protein